MAKLIGAMAVAVLVVLSTPAMAAGNDTPAECRQVTVCNGRFYYDKYQVVFIADASLKTTTRQILFDRGQPKPESNFQIRRITLSFGPRPIISFQKLEDADQKSIYDVEVRLPTEESELYAATVSNPNNWTDISISVENGVAGFSLRTFSK